MCGCSTVAALCAVTVCAWQPVEPSDLRVKAAVTAVSLQEALAR